MTLYRCQGGFTAFSVYPNVGGEAKGAIGAMFRAKHPGGVDSPELSVYTEISLFHYGGQGYG